MPLRRESQLNYAHLFSGTKPLAKLYLGKIGLPDFSVTFANLTANRYFRYNPANNNGSISPAYFGTQLDAVWYYYSNYAQASAQSTYQVDFKSTVTKTPSALEINGRSYALSRLTGITDATAYGTPAITRTEDIPSASSLTLSYKIRFSDGTYMAVDNSELIFENTNPPPITAFSVFPDTVDLDIADNHKTASVTFEKRSTGIYWFISRQYENRQTDTGSSSGFPSLVSVGHYYIGTTGRLSGPPSDSHYYQFAVRNTDSNYRDYNAIVINGRSYTVAASSSDFTEHGITGREYWTTDRIPNSADWVTDGRLTLSIQFRVSKVPDRLIFTYGVTGTAGQDTYAQVYAEPQASKVGPQVASTRGGNLAGSIPNIERPNKSQIYRLQARNSGGSSHRDITLTITKNPTIASLRRTNIISRTGFARYTFAMTITGLPQPTLTYRFSGGQTGTIPTSHYSQGANDYTWNVSGWSITFANANAQSLVVTASNSSGSVTATLSNING